jgi:Na+-translocating ferredoxin:NAD+ oxidoreductase RnfG subunit
MNEILIFLFGALIGTMLSVVGVYVMSYIKDQKIRQKNNLVFKQILTNLQNGKGKFISRINSTVQIDTKIKSEGKINMVFFIDKNEISIFKDGNCIYTSQNIDSDIINSIISMIWSRFSDRISDVVQLYNNIMDRKSFTRMVSQAKTEIQVINLDENGNIIDTIDDFKSTEPLTLDGILDRINQVGYDGLTQIEKDFLKNHK